MCSHPGRPAFVPVPIRDGECEPSSSSSPQTVASLSSAALALHMAAMSARGRTLILLKLLLLEQFSSIRGSPLDRAQPAHDGSTFVEVVWGSEQRGRAEQGERAGQSSPGECSCAHADGWLWFAGALRSYIVDDGLWFVRTWALHSFVRKHITHTLWPKSQSPSICRH